MRKKQGLGLLAALACLAGLTGCGKGDGKSTADAKAFNGENGKMPADFKAKMEAAQRNGANSAQRPAQPQPATH